MIAAIAVKEAGRRRSAVDGAWRLRVVERNVLAYRRMWLVVPHRPVEPLLYLLSIGIGVGALVGKVPGPGGQPIPYDQFVAPGLLAAAAMNGAVLDTTFNFFFKFKYAHTYDAMLATPLEVGDVARGRAGVGADPGRDLLGGVPADDGCSSGWSARGGRCSRCPRRC